MFIRFWTVPAERDASFSCFIPWALDVTGSDLSESMLTEAQRNPDKGGISGRLHKVDYREPPQLISE